MQKEKQIQLSVTERRKYLEEHFPEWEENTLAHHFYEQCRKYGDRPLLMMPDEVVSYGQMWDRSMEIARACLQLGIHKDDHVAVLMANDPDYIALWIAISMIGAVIVPLNIQLREKELAYMIGQSDSQWLIFHQFAGKQNHANTIRNILSRPDDREESKLKRIVGIQNSAEPLSGDFLPWEEFISGAENVPEQELKRHWETASDPHGTAAIIYTSGSTGLPKGVMLSDDMMLRSGFATCLSRSYEDGRRIFAPLPVYHVYFLEEGLLAVSFVGGAMITGLGFAPLQSLELMEKYRANDFLAVPSMLVSVLNRSELETFDLSSLTALLCCAAPSPVPLWEKAVRLLRVQEIGTGCGATEASSTTMLTEIGDPLEVVSSRVGKVKYAGAAGKKEWNAASVQYKVIDPDTGMDLPEGSVGELAVLGNVVTRGYYKKPEETRLAHTADGWLRSGDIGRIDENGYIQLLGRSKNLYKVSGETVAPKEVEDIISKHPAVTQAYIVGVPDRFTTETGAAFVELKENHACTEKEIREWCQDRLARFKVPRYVWFVHAAEWPLTATGKIQKFKLREMAEERQLCKQGR